MTAPHAQQHTRTIRVYEATATGIPPLRVYLQDIWKRRHFMWHLARTGLKARHYATVIGQLWILLDPLLMALVYYLLRTVVRPAGDSVERNGLIAHLIMGVMVYQFVSGSLRSGAHSITGKAQMILNTSFPRAIFPLISVGEALLDFIPTILVLMVTHAILGQPFGQPLVLFPLVIVMLTIFSLGLALLFACITVYFRDTSGFLPYITQVWLYATPVLYRISEIPPDLLSYLRWNPLFPFYAALESIFSAEWPSAEHLVQATGWTVGMFGAGALAFLKKEREFAARI